MNHVTRGRNPVSFMFAVNVSLVVASARWILYPYCPCMYYLRLLIPFLFRFDWRFSFCYLSCDCDLPFVLPLSCEGCNCHLHCVSRWWLHDGDSPCVLPIWTAFSLACGCKSPLRLWLICFWPRDSDPFDLSCASRLCFACWLACDIYSLLVLRLKFTNLLL